MNTRTVFVSPSHDPLVVIVDPLSHYSHVAPEDLLLSCGLLPGFVMNPGCLDLPLREALDMQYTFGLHEITDVIIDAEGRFLYPGDPTLYPLVEIRRGVETFYQYPYGLVAVRSAENTFITRMD